MKLLRLKITSPEGFRSLQSGFECFFRTPWERQEEEGFSPFVCAGPNGSGKSNLLEVLAAIFFHLDCKSLSYRPELFEYDLEKVPGGYREEVSIPSGFELEYLSKTFTDIKANDVGFRPVVKVMKEVGKGPQFYITNGDDFDPEVSLDARQIRMVLPDFVVAYSSGENEILSLPFFKMRFIHFDEYLDSIRNQTAYAGIPEGRLIFLDQDLSQAILLSNFILGQSNNIEPFKDEMGLEGVRYFRIILRDILYPSGRGISINDTEGWPLLGNVRGIQDKLRNCATSYFFDDETDTHYFDYWLDEECKKAFKLHFGTSLDLFRAFQLLLTLNLYSVTNQQKLEMYQSQSLYMNETVPTLPSDQRVMRFKEVVFNKTAVESIVYSKALSDGENQFLHTLGLCTLFRDSDALFLLDEPDTHFNPDWRSKFISQLKECLPEASGTNSREMLVTTHTPFLISDSRKEKVLVFDKNKKSGEVVVRNPDIQTFGASINNITFEVFNKTETIGDKANALIKELEASFDAGEDKVMILSRLKSELGDSIEKVLLTKTILDSLED